MCAPKLRETRPPGRDTRAASLSGRVRPIEVGLVLALVVSAGAVGYLSYGYFQTASRPPWLFQGAYAQYVTNYTIPYLPGYWPDTLDVQVLNYNSSKAEMSYYGNETTPCSEPAISNRCTYETMNITEWVPIGDVPAFAPLTSSLGANRTGPFNTAVSLNKHQYDVEAYRYEINGSLLYVYVYPKVGFPIMLGSSNVNYPSSYVSVYMCLTRTNIPGLPTTASTIP